MKAKNLENLYQDALCVKHMTSIFLFKSEQVDDQYLSKIENIKSYVIPTIMINPYNENEMLKSLYQPNLYQGLIITSCQPIYIIRSICDIKLNDFNMKTMWNHKNNYSISPKTSNTIFNSLGIAIKEEHQALNSLSLAQKIVEQSKYFASSLPFLFLKSEIALETIEKTLNENNIPVETLTVYRSIPHPNLSISINAALKIHSKLNYQFIYLVFFSPSCIKFSQPYINKFFEICSNIKYIALGPSTKQCLLDNGIDNKNISVCLKPHPQAIYEIITNFINTEKI